MKSIKQAIDKISNKQDFLEFIGMLVDNLKKSPDEWSNNRLENYLEAVARWTEDMDGYYVNNNLPVPTNADWKTFANILMAARSYE
ncbi:MAG: hypothetical protein ABIU63_17740 [Chitinophagaceae bacterium]